MNSKLSQHSNNKQTLIKKHQQIDELPHEENLEDDYHESSNIEQKTDDEINENLFANYDQMFTIYNQFGSKFQQTAHYIGLLIRKNMTLHSDYEDLQEEFEVMKTKNNQIELAYEEILTELNEKEKKIEDLLGENLSLKMQIEQLIMIPSQQQQQRQIQQQLNFQPQRDILKEREEAAERSKRQNQNSSNSKANVLEKEPQKSNDKKIQPLIQALKVEVKPEKVQNKSAQNQKQNNKPVEHMGGTFESFFEIEQPQKQMPDESCSLNDLFSYKNTKKRSLNEILDEDSKKDTWIVNKKKIKPKYDQESQMADRFEQLSQAFLQLGAATSNKTATTIKNQKSSNKNSERESIGSIILGNEDSASSVSLFSSNIRFDGKNAQENLRQAKLQFGNMQEAKQKQEKKFDIKIVEQVSDSLQEDFFTVKNEKKSNRGSNNSGANNNNKKSTNQKAKNTKLF